MPRFWRAETSTMIVSPPHCSGTRPSSDSCCMTWLGSASARSILLMATMIGTSAALAWLSASTVWGITPSSAATTSTTMSVTSAPRARMAVNASWPGVSMNVMTCARRRGHLVGADVLGDPAGLAGGDVGLADAVEQGRLAVVDVAHDGHDRRPRPQQLVPVLVVLFGEVPGLELGFFLLARLDQAHVGADLGREQLDHVVRERHRGGDHLALSEQEAHHVGRAAVEPRGQLLSRRTTLDDDLALGHRRVRRDVGRGCLRLQFFAAALPAPRAPVTARTSPRRAPWATAGAACAGPAATSRWQATSTPAHRRYGEGVVGVR